MQEDFAGPNVPRELPEGETPEDLAEIEPFSQPLEAVLPSVPLGGATLPPDLDPDPVPDRGGRGGAPFAAGAIPIPPLSDPFSADPFASGGDDPRAFPTLVSPGAVTAYPDGVPASLPAAPAAPAPWVPGAGRQGLRQLFTVRRRAEAGDDDPKPGCWPLLLTLLVALILLVCGSGAAVMVRNGGFGDMLPSLAVKAPTATPQPTAQLGCVANCDAATATASPTSASPTSPGAAPTRPPAPTNTPVPGAPLTPTATPDPRATHAAVTFTQASQTASGATQLSGCKSGCDITSTYGTYRKYGSGSHAATGGGGFWAVDILFTSNGSNCSPCHFDHITSSGNYCTNSPLTVSFPAGGSAWAQCQPYSTPVAAHDFQGAAVDANTSAVMGTMDNPGGSYWSGNPQVSQGDCDGAAQQAANASQSDNNHPSGLNFELSRWQGGVAYPTYCSPGVGAYASSTSSSAYHDMWWLGFNTPDAQNAAAAKPALSSGIPAGWAQKPSTASGCTNISWGNFNPGNNDSYTVTCARTAVVTYTWGPSDTTDLLNVLGGAGTLQAATDACNKVKGVQPGTCKIVLTGGDGQTMPASTSSISITVNPA